MIFEGFLPSNSSKLSFSLNIIIRNRNNCTCKYLPKITNIDIDKSVSDTINHIIEEYYDEYSGVYTKSKKMLKELDG